MDEVSRPIISDNGFDLVSLNVPLDLFYVFARNVTEVPTVFITSDQVKCDLEISHY